LGLIQDVIGRRLKLDRNDRDQFTVIGVAGSGGGFPLRTDVWMPDIDKRATECAADMTFVRSGV